MPPLNLETDHLDVVQCQVLVLTDHLPDTLIGQSHLSIVGRMIAMKLDLLGATGMALDMDRVMLRVTTVRNMVIVVEAGHEEVKVSLLNDQRRGYKYGPISLLQHVEHTEAVMFIDHALGQTLSRHLKSISHANGHP